MRSLMASTMTGACCRCSSANIVSMSIMGLLFWSKSARLDRYSSRIAFAVAIVMWDAMMMTQNVSVFYSQISPTRCYSIATTLFTKCWFSTVHHRSFPLPCNCQSECFLDGAKENMSGLKLVCPDNRLANTNWPQQRDYVGKPSDDEKKIHFIGLIPHLGRKLDWILETYLYNCSFHMFNSKTINHLKNKNDFIRA